MKKSCELCERKAEMYCDSDKAFLCCGCDAVVHSANFLVARHSRRLLCHVCMSLTQWTAAGRKLTPAVSLCRNCVLVEEDLSFTDENYDDYDDDDSDDEGGGLEEENQVVPPWSTAEKQEAEAEGEASSSEESTYGQLRNSRKRMRNVDNDEGNKSQIILTPSTTAEFVAVVGACGERHASKDEKYVVETSSTLTNSNETTKCRRVEMGGGGDRTVEEIEWMIGKHEMCEEDGEARDVDLESEESS